MGKFADLVDYDKMFAELEQRRKLSTEEKEEIKFICNDELKRHSGTSLGHIFINGIYLVGAFVGSLLKNFKLSDPIESLSKAADASGQKLDAHIVNSSGGLAYARLHERFPDLASEITGQYPVSQADEIPTTPPQHNLYAQLMQKRNVPANVSPRLGVNS